MCVCFVLFVCVWGGGGISFLIDTFEVCSIQRTSILYVCFGFFSVDATCPSPYLRESTHSRARETLVLSKTTTTLYSVCNRVPFSLLQSLNSLINVTVKDVVVHCLITLTQPADDDELMLNVLRCHLTY